MLCIPTYIFFIHLSVDGHLGRHIVLRDNFYFEMKQ